MKYQCASEKAAIISRQMTGNSEIRKLKQQIILSISIELFIMMIYFILQIGVLIFDKTQHGKGIFIESFITIISIVYLIAFFIVLTRYFPNGILIFAWLTLIQLIGGSIIFILAIIGIIISLSLIHSVGAEIIVDIIFTIIGIAIIILSVLIILYSLNLLKLIKTY